MYEPSRRTGCAQSNAACEIGRDVVIGATIQTSNAHNFPDLGRHRKDQLSKPEPLEKSSGEADEQRLCGQDTKPEGFRKAKMIDLSHFSRVPSATPRSYTILSLIQVRALAVHQSGAPSICEERTPISTCVGEYSSTIGGLIELTVLGSIPNAIFIYIGSIGAGEQTEVQRCGGGVIYCSAFTRLISLRLLLSSFSRPRHPTDLIVFLFASDCVRGIGAFNWARSAYLTHLI